jgi:hypothetical protein
MKFTSRLFSVLVISTVLLLSTVNACEESCRVGISKAFSDKYTIELSPRFKLFNNDINSKIFNKIQLNKFMSSNKVSPFKKQVLKDLKPAIAVLSKNFGKLLTNLVKDAIFNQEPKFKGQCQNPLKVVQPPVGTPWDPSDCVKQDYICGNPPAICHFMDEIVKPRNVNNVRNLLKTKAQKNGEFFRALIKVIKKSTLKFANKGKATGLDKLLTTNINARLNVFSKEFSISFCKGTTCDKYDAEIENILLSFP